MLSLLGSYRFNVKNISFVLLSIMNKALVSHLRGFYGIKVQMPLNEVYHPIMEAHRHKAQFKKARWENLTIPKSP